MDFGYRSENLNSMEKLQDCINYAILCEELGYDKFWIGEHHMPKKTLPWNDPTNLIPILANYTKNITIGTAGVLMCIHNPYHVASSYKFLNNIFPKRIDLGFANGTPYNGVAMQSNEKNNIELVKEFEYKLRKTIYFLREEDALYKESGIVLPPFKGLIPELWTLSGSEGGIKRAIALETNLSFWVTENFDPGLRDRIDSYKVQFYEKYKYQPKLRAVLFGICHETESKAKKIAEWQNEKITPMHGHALMFGDFIRRCSDYYNVQDFMYFNSIRNLHERSIGIEALSYELGINPNLTVTNDISNLTKSYI